MVMCSLPLVAVLGLFEDKNNRLAEKERGETHEGCVPTHSELQQSPHAPKVHFLPTELLPRSEQPCNVTGARSTSGRHLPLLLLTNTKSVALLKLHGAEGASLILAC